ncbi:hypothetical protein [Acinetobacter sp.]|uniref:hypothetical protein n=1 Tax=Acinetobacter sp. TaxID=472 RepID=UPI003CFC93E8
MLITEKYPVVTHDIWNTIDEYGLQLDLPRLPGETNSTYLERLARLVKNNVGSSRQGIVNALSAIFNRETYSLSGQKVFLLRFKHVSHDDRGQSLPVKVVLTDSLGNIVEPPQAFSTTWDTSDSTSWILWKNYDNTYGNVLEFKTAPATGMTVDIWYYTKYNDEVIPVHDAFTGLSADTPSAEQITVNEIADPTFIEQYRDTNGELSSDYYRLLTQLNSSYKRTWGQFEWDRYYWDDASKLNTIPTSYDRLTIADTGSYENGVGHGDALKMTGITADGNLVIRTGVFYHSGYEYYLYAHKHTQYLEPDSESGIIGDDIPMTMTYLNENNEEQSRAVNPVYGSPVIANTADLDDILIVGYTDNYIVHHSDFRAKYVKSPDENLTNDGANIARTFHYPVMSAMKKQLTTDPDGSFDHNHLWTFYSNIVDAAKQNGITDPAATDGHTHLIIGGEMQETGGHTHQITIPKDYGYWEPTPYNLRKRREHPTSILMDSDNKYFILNPTDNGTSITPCPIFSIVKHKVEFELGGGDYIVPGSDGPILDANLYHLSRTFVGIGPDLPILMNKDGSLAGLQVFTSRQSVRHNQVFGVSVLLNDTSYGRIADAEIVVTAPENYMLSELIEGNIRSVPFSKVNLGHTYTDGTKYARICFSEVDPAVLAGESASANLTVSVSITTSADWSSYPGCADAKVKEENGLTTYLWNKTLEIRYDG